MIATKNLTKYFGTQCALHEITFHVTGCGVIGFLGENGAGKSTLMRILSGILEPTSGQAWIAGVEVRQGREKIAPLIGYLPEGNPLYPEMRIEEFLRYRARAKGIKGRQIGIRVDYALASCSLERSRKRIISQLSKGYRQRVGISDCLLADSPILILDEPTVGLDPNQVREIRSVIENVGHSRMVFLSSHILHEVERLCRDVVIIHDGRLIAMDSPANLCSSLNVTENLILEFRKADGASELLSSLTGVVRYALLDGAADGCLRLQLSHENGVDLRKSILSLFVARGWDLLEMQNLPICLEDIFSQLTRGRIG